MGINRVEFKDGDVLMDLTSDTLSSPEQLLEGVTAHNNLGDLIVGTLVPGAVGGPTLHTVTSTCDNANEVVEYFRKLRPSGCNDMLVVLNPPSGLTAFSKMENGQLLNLALNGTKAGYARWYSSAVNVQTTFTTSYTCKCWAGDEYYLFPLY